MLDRLVTIRPTIVTGRNARGDDVLGPGTPIVDVPAARELEATSEDHALEDLTTRRWVYFLPAFHAGELLAVDDHALIDDVDGTFSIIGEPELVVRRRRRGRPHHYELVAERKE